jgi:hypothetical protein
MLDLTSETDLLGIVVLGIGGAVLGLVGLLSGGRRGWLARAGTVAAVLLGLAGGSALAVGLPRGLWLPPLALAGACALFGAARSPRLGRAAAVLRRPAVQWGALLALAPALALGAAYRAALPPDEPGRQVPHLSSPDPETLRPAEGAWATTDRGRPVPLFAYPAGPALPGTLAEEEETALGSRVSSLRVIRAGPPDPSSNCHGWVFTGGRCWVKGEAVEGILQDNGYQRVEAPRPGDLVVYRDERGAVSHTGVVSSVGSDGLVLVESKWGWLGRYVHAAEAHPYGPDFSYHHSPRTGHLLRLTNSPPPPATTGNGLAVARPPA